MQQCMMSSSGKILLRFASSVISILLKNRAWNAFVFALFSMFWYIQTICYVFLHVEIYNLFSLTTSVRKNFFWHKKGEGNNKYLGALSYFCSQVDLNTINYVLMYIINLRKQKQLLNWNRFIANIYFRKLISMI